MQPRRLDEFDQAGHYISTIIPRLQADLCSQLTTRARCTHCRALAGCLGALTIRIKKEHALHTEMNEQYMRACLNLHICRTSLQSQDQKLVTALRRSEARCSRMNSLISHLVSENQRKDDLISGLQERNNQLQNSESLQCASSLLQLSQAQIVNRAILHHVGITRLQN